MTFVQEVAHWWRNAVEPVPKAELVAIKLLRQRFVEEIQRSDRFKEYAKQMDAPQYRARFLSMAEQTSRDAAAIGEKLLALGAKPPALVQSDVMERNSWGSLSAALDEETRAAARFVKELWRIESARPDIAKLLLQIFQKQGTQRRQIQYMLMRSDPFAHSFA